MEKNSLEVQWLGLHVLTAMSTGSIPCYRTKILHALQHGQKRKKKSHVTFSLYETEYLLSVIFNIIHDY